MLTFHRHRWGGVEGAGGGGGAEWQERPIVSLSECRGGIQ